MKNCPRPKTSDSKQAQVPKSVWSISFSSFLMDVSSEMVNSFLPLFIMANHGASASAIGLIEGLIESKGFIVKFFSGAYSDRLGKRKRLAVIGYGLSTLTKPLFALDLSLESLIGARMLDRVGKGVRGPPRDALIADLTPPHLRGTAFGLRQFMDTAGALLGPLLATGILWWIPGGYQIVFLIASIPGVLSVWILQRRISEPRRFPFPNKTSGQKPIWLPSLPAPFWWVCLMGAVLCLARVGQAFMILRVEESGIPVWQIPLILVFSNLVFACTAFPFGKLCDRVSNRLILSLGTVVLIAADLLFATSADETMMMGAVVLFGLHLGMTQTPLAKMIVDSAPESLRGTAFGVFHLFWGVSMLLSSACTGFFWEHHGSIATFKLAAGVALAILPFIALAPHISRLAKMEKLPCIVRPSSADQTLCIRSGLSLQAGKNEACDMGQNQRHSEHEMQNSAAAPTGQPVHVTIDNAAWHEGADRARQGGSSFDNPYPLGSAEAYSWLLGFVSCGNDPTSS